MEEHGDIPQKVGFSIESVTETVTTLGSQVKEQVTKVFDLKLGKSYIPEDDSRLQSESLLSPISPSKSNYGSIPNTFRSIPDIDPMLPRRRTLTDKNSLQPDNYFRKLTDTFPSASVEKISQLAGRDSYDAGKFRPSINDEVNQNYISGNISEVPSSTPDPTSLETNSSENEENPERFTWYRYLKIGIVLVLFFAAAVTITLTNESLDRFIQISSTKDQPYSFPIGRLIPFSPAFPLMTVSVNGEFVTEEFANVSEDRLYISVHRIDQDTGVNESISEVWAVPIMRLPFLPDITLSHTFSLKNLTEIFMKHDDDDFYLLFETTTDMSFPVFTSVKLYHNFIESGALFGGLVIIGLYILIIFELLNRTLSAMLAATVAIGILAAFGERPTTEELVSWLDMETLFLLFSMMVMVSILCDTGFFNYCAFIMYKITKGAIWPMITALCLFTAVVSAFLDNVTTILLMTPVTIRICEAMRLNPVPVLIITVIFSNIGGAATPVGDPPNVIIANDPDVVKEGIDFTTFALNMTLGIIPVAVVAYFQIRVMFRSNSSLQFEIPYETAELKREIEIWRRAVSSLSSYSKDESQVKAILESKVLHLRSDYKMMKKFGGQTVEGYTTTLAELEESCRIKDRFLLIKCAVVLSLVIILFFFHTFPQLKLSMGWTALLGAVLLLTLADKKELDGVLARVEWSTLIFFSALFIVMEAVSRLGLLTFIGKQTEGVILLVSPEFRMITAILIILWVSGLASAFIDNIPFTTMMIKIVTKLSQSLGLPLHPLVWALALGTCLGGNGTLIGASANVVCAGVADQHGYRFSFVDYFKIGFPMMIVSLLVASAYLTICYYTGFF